jgi:23S rRNA-/tRNA-specific pseudouridylate synthase
MTARPHYQVLYQDADIVAIAKPYGALSTPGREFRVKAVPRSEEWANSILELCLRKRVDAAASETYSNAVEILRRQARVVPRQKEKFLSLLERTARLKDDVVKERIWNDVVHLDKELHALDPDSLPDHLFSAADFASQITGETVYHVHRLDQETSGVLLFAKSSVAASVLSKQFREREVLFFCAFSDFFGVITLLFFYSFLKD